MTSAALSRIQRERIEFIVRRAVGVMCETLDYTLARTVTHFMSGRIVEDYVAAVVADHIVEMQEITIEEAGAGASACAGGGHK